MHSLWGLRVSHGELGSWTTSFSCDSLVSTDSRTLPISIPPHNTKVVFFDGALVQSRGCGWEEQH